ncbi:hypothetical protein [Stratiformator vulcanicus]|uniref:hypothetical protein n=1 Tax=Stratiformator vulcanicus TaxID=2527980 RepID=UPI0028777690|nr:hypothetical protein [Stratiformator vulcanicus]
MTAGNYVDADYHKSKPGFFSNGGVYFDNKVEVQIFDTASLLAAMTAGQVIIGGNTANVSGTVVGGKVDMTGGTKPWLQEDVASLITGVPYNETDATLLTDLQNAPQGGGSITMRIQRLRTDDNEPSNNTYSVLVKLGDGDWIDYGTIEGGTGGGKTRPKSDTILFQQHWGSGVIYSNIRVKEIVE